MGLLDSVIGALAGAQGGSGAGAGGGQAQLIQIVLGMLAQAGGGSGGAANGGLGGLGELVSRMQQGGLGDVVGSWIGTGQNLPISGDQLGSVLGPDALAQIAAQLGLSHGDAADQLSQVLPQVVDHLTPQGRLPEGGLAEAGGVGDIGDLLARLSGR